MLNNQKPEPLVRAIGGNPSELSLHSIFATIQGEGPFTGQRAIFIRLAGCNLQCPQCDTDYTIGRSVRSVDDIANRAADLWLEATGKEPAHDYNFAEDHARPLVVITGGEPFRQPLALLLRRLLRHKFRIQIETNGVYPCTQIPEFLLRPVHIVCSPKTRFVHPSIEENACAFKYVASAASISPLDGLPIKVLENAVGGKGEQQVWRPGERAGSRCPIYLQPADEQDQIKNQANLKAVVDSCMRYGYILCLQTHKIAGLE